MDAYTVYKHYDKNGVLLYVGRSKRIEKREAMHKQKSEWWFDVIRTEMVHFISFEEARRYEADAICLENPKYNKMKPWHHATIQSCPTHGTAFIAKAGHCRMCQSEYRKKVRVKRNKGRVRQGRRDQKVKPKIDDLYDPLENGMPARVYLSHPIKVKPYDTLTL